MQACAKMDKTFKIIHMSHLHLANRKWNAIYSPLIFLFFSHGKLVDVVYCQLSLLTTLSKSLLILFFDAIRAKKAFYKGCIRLINNQVSNRHHDSFTKWNSRRLMLKFYVFLILKQNPPVSFSTSLIFTL